MKKNVTLSVAALLASTLASTSAYSSGYAVNLFSGWAAGMANAGHGVQDDPMLSLINPAAMILNKCHHAAFNITGVFPSVKFKGEASNPAIPFEKSGTTKNGAKTVAIPSMGFVWRMAEDLRFSLAVTAPAGLKFNYGDDSITQFHTKRAELMTINIAPSFAYRVNELFTLGVGFQAQYTKVKMTRNVGLPVLQNKIGSTSLNISEWNHGWTAGMLMDLSQKWKFGVGYRSNIDANMDGHATFATPAFNLAGAPLPANVVVPVAAFSAKGKASAKAFIPHVVTLSTSYDITQAWTAYASAVWSGWKTTKSLDIKTNINTPAVTLGAVTLIPSRNVADSIAQNWKNAWFFSGGVNYKVNDTWSVRTGLGYDQSPTKNSTRIPAIPDTNKWWLGLGGTYTRGKWATTLTYGHEFFKKGKIELDNNDTDSKSTLVGKMSSHIDMVSLQINYRY